MAAKNLRPVLEGQRLKARKRGASMTPIIVVNVLSQCMQQTVSFCVRFMPLCVTQGVPGWGWSGVGLCVHVDVQVVSHHPALHAYTLCF